MVLKEDRLQKRFAGILDSIARRIDGGEQESKVRGANDGAEQRLNKFLEKEFGTCVVNELAVYPKWLTDEAIAYYCALFDEDIRVIRDNQNAKRKRINNIAVSAIIVGLWTAIFGGLYFIVGVSTIIAGLMISVGAYITVSRTPSARIGDQELFVLLLYQDVAREFLRRINDRRASLG